jgi:uncharacterized protein (TIGR03000 family)
VVSLPAEASLTINKTPTRSNSDTRTFVTPPLLPGREFRYTLQAEVVRDGNPVTLTMQVAVRAGEKKKVTFTFPSVEGVAQK